MNKIICYFNSNYVDINKNNRIIHIVSNSIENGDIIHKNEFIEKIKKRKIFSNIFVNEVDIYLNHIIEEKDTLYYKTIFEDLNCNIISVLDTSKLLNGPTLINSNNIYILYCNKKYFKIIPELLNDYLRYLKINELKIISRDKLRENKNVLYYYYNYKNEYFIN